MVSKITSEKNAILKTEGKISVKNQENCISELPDDILSSIVSYFTLSDAVRASLVSRKWRHFCASKSLLSFNWYNMFRKQNVSKPTHHCCEDYKDRFVPGVTKFLPYHRGSRLVYFGVSFCLDSDCTSDIDQWVSFALSKGVEWLALCLTCRKGSVRRKNLERRSLYTLRSELLSHDNAAKVHRLLLCSCIPGPSAIERFCFVKELTLVHMPLGQENVECIISCCLNLESMILNKCFLVVKLCISGSLKRLKFLSVFHCLDLTEIELCASDLTTFEYGPNMIRFSLCGVPNLKSVHFKVDDGIGVQYVCRELAKDFPLVKSLSVLSKANGVRTLPKDVTTFHNVKRLYLSCTKGELDMGRIIPVLRACPILEYFRLVVRDCIQQFEEGTDGVTESVNKRLKEVCIGGFDYGTTLIEFAIYLLEHAPALEKLILTEKNSVYTGAKRWDSYKDDKKWDEGDRQKVREQLQEHSKSAVISMSKYFHH